VTLPLNVPDAIVIKKCTNLQEYVLTLAKQVFNKTEKFVEFASKIVQSVLQILNYWIKNVYKLVLLVIIFKEIIVFLTILLILKSLIQL